MKDFTPPPELELFRFASQADVDRWATFQDKDAGGRSTASFRLSEEHPVRFAFAALLRCLFDPVQAAQEVAVLEGSFSKEMDDSAPEESNERRIKRSGFCGVSSKVCGCANASEVKFDCGYKV